MAAELTDADWSTLAANSGYDVNTDLLSGAAPAYTASPAFPGQFGAGQPDRAPLDVHRLRCAAGRVGRWEVDLSPMLADSSFQQTLQDFGIQVRRR